MDTSETDRIGERLCKLNDTLVRSRKAHHNTQIDLALYSGNKLMIDDLFDLLQQQYELLVILEHKLGELASRKWAEVED